MCTTTSTLLLPPGASKISAAIADDAYTICGEPCPHKLTVLPLFNPFSCLRINTLHQESIGPCMHTVASFAFAGHTRPKELGHAKLIIGGDIEQFLQLEACLPRPWHITQNPNPYLAISQIIAHP